MHSSDPAIHCPNLSCPNPINSLGQFTCRSCGTPLSYRYLWAVGDRAKEIPVGEQVAGRYAVLAPCLWLDTQPGLSPEVPQWLPDEIIPYLRLFSHRLHVPEVYGFCCSQAESKLVDILLLENIPVDHKGHLCPSIAEMWPQATAARQVYWLWQMLQLWPHLNRLGVASSLLVVDNVRVDGWRIRLKKLYLDAIGSTGVQPEMTDEPDTTPPPDDDGDSTVGFSRVSQPQIGPFLTHRFPEPPTLQALADSWFPLALSAQAAVSRSLQDLCEQMQLSDETLKRDEPSSAPAIPSTDIPETITQTLNRILLEQAAQLPLQLRIFGLSDPGPQRSHNEDTCYPTWQDLQPSNASGLLPSLSLVCDGIGGHEGGEVASQLAAQSLKLQMQALLQEVQDQSTEILSPELVGDQIRAAIRVANNLIATQNNTQGREARQRMGTTLVMGLQLPQPIPLRSGEVLTNSHELYIAHAGDSRAYWMTASGCCQLTVDDDVSVREVRLGRSLYREALKRSDAGALTQALGTRDAEFLQPTIQRLIIEEDGLLLLCSDGLSDNGWVEYSWTEYVQPVLEGCQSLESAAQFLVELANRKNGYDNTSVVLLHCQVSPSYPQLIDPRPGVPTSQEEELSEASRALLYGEIAEEDAVTAIPPDKQPPWRKWLGLGLMLLLLIGGGLAFGLWWQSQSRSPSDRPPNREIPRRQTSP